MGKSKVARITQELDNEIRKVMLQYKIDSYVVAQKLLLNDIQKLREQHKKFSKSLQL